MRGRGFGHSRSFGSKASCSSTRGRVSRPGAVKGISMVGDSVASSVGALCAGEQGTMVNWRTLPARMVLSSSHLIERSEREKRTFQHAVEPALCQALPSAFDRRLGQRVVVYRYHLVSAPQALVLDGREVRVEGADHDGAVLSCSQGVQIDSLSSAHAAVDLHDVYLRACRDSPIDGLVRREDVFQVRAQDGDGLAVGASLGRVFRGPAKI